MAKKEAPAKIITDYTHQEERLNNPPVGLVNTKRDPEGKPRKYEYDHHLDPELQWAGKSEHTSFEVPTVSLHVHERIDPKSIIKTVRNQNETQKKMSLVDFFKSSKKPLREAVEFYKHKDNWSNRIIAGDSLLVMNSLLEKEGIGGKIQMIYFDPPYGIKYGSNFQPFINKRDVKDGKDQDLNQETEMIKAFRDTWELGIHSYLTYMRDRLLLCKELLSEKGSIFVQISDENQHHVRELMDEIFGKENFIVPLLFKKTGSMSGNYISGITDTLLWYGKNKSNTTFNRLYQPRSQESINSGFPYVDLKDGTFRRLKKEELQGTCSPPEGRRFQTSPVMSSGEPKDGSKPVNYQGRDYYPAAGNHWKIAPEELQIVAEKGRLLPIGKTMTFKKYLDEAPYTPLTNMWMDTMESTYAVERYYVVQTAEKVVRRCIEMTTNTGDLVFDLTCGSGTTAKVAEETGRRWITCDTSRIATSLTKKRLVTSIYDYFHLKNMQEGISGGFRYKTVPKITLKAVATGGDTPKIDLYDQPLIDSSKTRVTGPFTVEALPAARSAISIEEIEHRDQTADDSVTRSGETGRQAKWRDELFKTGIRAKGGSKIEFTRLEASNGRRKIHSEGETKDGKKVLVVFGPEHAPLEQTQVELALEEVEHCKPQPELVIFAAIQFDPEASKDIDEMQWPGMDLLRVQMNTDLFTDDLKKKRSSNESFWLIGQPDIEVKKADDELFTVKVRGFDYYDPKTGKVESGNENKIAMWLLDTDYDGRSLCPTQIFFPMAGPKDGWGKLAKTLRAEIDEEKIEMFRGTEAIPFKKGRYERVAVKIVDDRGIESLVIRELKG